MAEVALVVVVAVLAIQNVFLVRYHRAERERLVDAVVARHAPDFVALSARPKAKKDPKPAPEPVEPVGR